MTKSTITRERLEWLSQISCRDDIEDIGGDEIRELASMALAAMDSEPVAWTWHYREQWHVTNDERRAEFVATDGDVAVLPLYRHAQPVPVVPKEMTAGIAVKHWEGGKGSIESFVAGYNFCRATMLQASPVCTCPSGDGSLRWPCPVHPGNSPAQSDCCPAQNHVSLEQNGDTSVQSQGWIPVRERMPESNGMYFGWDGKRVLEVYCFFGGFSANQFIHGEITHWMPLPAAPQEVKGE
ncbi:DUF551 domain-containing protein [Klebsiella quasivariicola]